MNAGWMLRPPSPRLEEGNALVVAAVAIVGGALGLELVLQVVGAPTFGLLGTGGERLWVALVTAVMSGGLAAIATRATTPGGAIALCFLALPAGLMNTVVCLMGVWAMKTGISLDGMIFCTLCGGMYGIILGGPLGALLGFVYAWPILAFVRARRDGSLDASDRVLVWTGGFAVVMGTATAGLAFAKRGVDVAVCFHITIAALGAVALAIGGVRRFLRARWLRAVRAGRVADFCVVPGLDPRWDTDGALPFAGEPLFACDALLVRASDIVIATAYRDRVTPPALALVRSDERDQS